MKGLEFLISVNIHRIYFIRSAPGLLVGLNWTCENDCVEGWRDVVPPRDLLIEKEDDHLGLQDLDDGLDVGPALLDRVRSLVSSPEVGRHDGAEDLGPGTKSK